MKRLALALTAVLGAIAVGALRLRCAWRGHPNARRQPGGGYRCPAPCFAAHGSLPTLEGDDRISPVRKTFERDHEAVIRSAGF